MAKASRKGRCPGCGTRMKLADRYCGACGKRNPLLVAAPVRRRTSVKSASGCAPVIPLPLGAVRESPLWRDFYGQPDPAKREEIASFIFKQAGTPGNYGGAA